MGETTAIAWTDHTFNPWWGCTRVSPGCEHCYAEAFAKRTGHAVWGKRADRRSFGPKHWTEPERWNEQARADGRPHLVFCASMADVFEDRPELADERVRLWDLIERTPFLIWQLLTKRPENVLELTPAGWHGAGFADRPRRLWPRNVWIGTTVEDQQRADERIHELLAIPAPVRFLSCEPLLGSVTLPPLALVPERVHTGSGPSSAAVERAGNLLARKFASEDRWRGIDWVIVGGESGPGHRPLDLEHARALRDQCHDATVPFFFKQVGGRTPTAGGDLLDGEQLKAFPSQAARGSVW